MEWRWDPLMKGNATQDIEIKKYVCETYKFSVYLGTRPENESIP